MLLIKRCNLGCQLATRRQFQITLTKGNQVKISPHTLNLLISRSSSYYTFPVFTGTQYALEMFHHYSYIPWWATIACTTLVLRTAITLPLSIKQNKLTAKMELLKPALKEITDAVRHNIIVRGQRDGKGKAEIQRELFKELRLYTQDFYSRNGVSPWKLFLLPWTQLPLWITVSFALRNISGCVPTDTSAASDAVYLPSTGVETEGLLWFSNLSVPDPYFAIPAVLLLTNLLNIELSTLRQQAPSNFSKVLTNAFRGLSGLMFLVAIQVPSAMSLYWACSSAYGLSQNIVMKFPAVRRRFNIPKTPSEHERPFVIMLDVLRKRTRNFLDLQQVKK